MEVRKIPLRDRLQALSNCSTAHEEYIPALLRDFSQLPITAYLADFPEEELEHFADLVQYPVHYLEELTYSDIAVRVRQMHHRGKAGEALELLAKPLTAIYQRHLERSGSNG